MGMSAGPHPTKSDVMADLSAKAVPALFLHMLDFGWALPLLQTCQQLERL